MNKLNFSEPTEVTLKKNVVLTVFPASLETLCTVTPLLEKLDSEESMSLPEQMELFTDIVFALIKDDNSLDKETLKKSLTVPASLSIIGLATSKLTYTPEVKNEK